METSTTVTHTYLYIPVSHKTAEEMADRYAFTAAQRQQLAELLAEENRSMWSAVLYGIYSGDDAIVMAALSQVGNVGGQPYWLWYGFENRVEWCACFVSWCANECGYIDSGVVPKFAGCVGGVQWFKDRGQWLDGSAEPTPGMIIFFDWNNKGSSGPTMWGSWRKSRTVSSTPWRAIPGIPADRTNIPWDIMRSWGTVYRNISLK